jgi:putative ABC transport system permease protein
MLRGLSYIRHCVRTYAATPHTSLMSVTALAVGIAGCIIFFSIYNDLSLKNVPGVETPSAMVSITTAGASSEAGFNGRFVDYINERSYSMNAIAGYVRPAANPILVSSQQTDVYPTVVTAEYFSGLGIRLSIGRYITSNDHRGGGRAVTIISDRMARRWFDGAENALGMELEIEGEFFEIVGVTDARFVGTEFGTQQDVWVPLSAYVTLCLELPESFTDILPLHLVGRLKSGIFRNRAQEELRAISSLYQQEVDRSLDGSKVRLLPNLAPDVKTHKAFSRQAAAFTAVAMLLTLMAAGNLSLLLVSRAPARNREYMIRYAIGASFMKLTRQMLVEISFIIAVSSFLGLFIAYLAGEWIRDALAVASYSWARGGLLDWRVVMFFIIMALSVGVLTAISPIVHLRSHILGGGVKDNFIRIGQAKQIVVFCQIALSAIVLAAALHLLQMLISAIHSHPGYELNDRTVITIRASSDSGHSGHGHAHKDHVRYFREQVSDRLLSISDVQEVAFSSALPGTRLSISAPPGAAPEGTHRGDQGTGPHQGEDRVRRGQALRGPGDHLPRKAVPARGRYGHTSHHRIGQLL